MGHTNVKNTYVGVPLITGGIWRYPQSVVLPTDAYSARPAGGQYLGGVSDAGVTWMSARNTDKKADWNGNRVRSVQKSKEDGFKIEYIEFLNANVNAEIFGPSNVTIVAPSLSHGTQIATKSVADILGHYSYIVDRFDGTVKRRSCMPDAQVDKVDDVKESPGDWSIYTVTYDLFPDSQGGTKYDYTELADKLFPSNWTVTITGSAGTFTVTVDGQTTAAIVYNAATSAVKTAIELLSTVGSGNSTVGGSPGAYAVSLLNGGTLSAVGTGGATAVVAAV